MNEHRAVMCAEEGLHSPVESEKSPTIIELQTQCLGMMRENLYLAQCLTAAVLGIGPTEEKRPDPQNMRDAAEVQTALACQIHDELLRLLRDMGCGSL